MKSRAEGRTATHGYGATLPKTHSYSLDIEYIYFGKLYIKYRYYILLFEIYLFNGVDPHPSSSGDVPHHLLKEQHRGRGPGLFCKGLLQGLLQQVLIEL